jgi:hypothetical protein
MQDLHSLAGQKELGPIDDGRHQARVKVVMQLNLRGHARCFTFKSRWERKRTAISVSAVTP